MVFGYVAEGREGRLIMWVLLMVSLWSGGGVHSQMIAQFQTEQLCQAAQQAMRQGISYFERDAAEHVYRCERLPEK